MSETAKAVEHVVTVLNLLNCGAALVSATGEVIYLNARSLSMMRQMPSELLGKNVLELYANDPAAVSFLKTVLSQPEESQEYEFYLPVGGEGKGGGGGGGGGRGGGRVPVICSSRQLPPPLEDMRVMTLQDISKQKEAEAGLKEQFKYISQLSDTAFSQAISLKRHSSSLEDVVKARTLEIRQANLDAIYMLAEASEAKDHETGQHVRRIQQLSELLARKAGLTEASAVEIGYSAVLHDVGKLHVPDGILQKPGKLTTEEFDQIKQHTVAGEKIISDTPFFAVARRIARSHHENYDGSGYPDGLCGGAIPLEARMVRVADVYDALGKKRVYKQAWDAGSIRAYFIEQAGKLFDPMLARAMVELISEGKV